MCLGCIRYEVSATLVGRLDGIESASLERDKAGKITGIGGFGNLNAYSARLVLESVSDVTPKEIDYSKVIEASKSESSSDAGPGPGGPGASIDPDPFAAAHKAAAGFGAGNPLGAQLERAAAAFGSQKDKNNSVTVSYGVTSEAIAKYDSKGTASSPDGLLFNCFFNKSHLSGDALARAVVHIGAHIADVRSPAAGFENAGLYEFEYRGWVQTVVDGVAANQKTLSAPGGYVLWNTAVPEADRNSSLNAALMEFLSKEELLTR
jgi:hypothetical protein